MEVGRNEPCPCGSGKKFKRCCGFSEPVVTAGPSDAPASPLPGIDPSQFNPEWMAQMSQALQRLPKGQMQKLQSLMQKAVSGKDISREADAFEKTLPVSLQGLLQSAPSAQTESGQPVDSLPAEETSKLKKGWRKLFGS